MPTATISDAIPRGQAHEFPLILEGSGSIAGATLAVHIKRRGGRGVLNEPTATIADAASRSVLVSCTAADTLTWEGDPADPTHEIEHVLDLYVTIAGVLTIYGPLVFPVRDPA